MAEKDSSPVTRLYLASAAGRLPPADRWDILQGLAAHAADAGDHNLPLMIWYAAEPLAEVDPERALAFAIQAGKNIPVLRDYMLRRIGSRGDQAAVTTLVAGLNKATDVNVTACFPGSPAHVADRTTQGCPTRYLGGRIEEAERQWRRSRSSASRSLRRNLWR